jgi:hypothetical protein
MVSLVCNEPVFVLCSRFDVCGDRCPECDGMGEYPVDVSWFVTLVHNLVVAGGLDRAYNKGRYDEKHAWFEEP